MFSLLVNPFLESGVQSTDMCSSRYSAGERSPALMTIASCLASTHANEECPVSEFGDNTRTGGSDGMTALSLAISACQCQRESSHAEYHRGLYLACDHFKARQIICLCDLLVVTTFVSFHARPSLLASQVSNCHFCSPPRCVSAFGGALDAMLTPLILKYSCAREAHTFLCCFVWAFLQSREQYRTLLHEIQGFRFGDSIGSEESSDFEQFAQCFSCACDVAGSAA